MKGKTEDHKDYWRHSIKTKLALIRYAINTEEDCIRYYNKWLSLHKSKILFEAKKNGEIIDLKENILFLKDYIVELEGKIDKEVKPIEKTSKKTYLMKNVRNGFYKIGVSNNPKKRERTLQSQEPEVKMVKVWSDNIEKELHLKYKEHRVRGEWFNLNKIQVKHICTKY